MKTTNATASHIKAFTLVELLVVLGIVTVLMTLILPALQKVREAANKALCANNLRQLAVAFHVHHHDHGAFPVGGGKPIPPAGEGVNRTVGGTPCGIGNTNVDNSTNPIMAPSVLHDQELGWPYQILPHIEQENLWSDSLDKIRETPVKTYFCPSRRSPTVVDKKAKGDYGACIGVNSERTLGKGLMVGRQDKAKTPLIGLTSGMIPDGASNTILLGEKRVDPSRLAGWSDSSFFCAGWSDNLLAAIFQPKRDESGISPAGLQFGSSHLNSMNAAFGDGSVRAIRYSVQLNDPSDPEKYGVFMRACRRDDGKPYNLEDL
jgi:prepilin-type N-terminal cleavage/methylation domain-containing protein